MTIAPATASIFDGQTQAFTATLRDSAGGIMTGPTVTWSSTATAVATVSTSGVASGVSGGLASIIASSGGHSDTAALTVAIVPVASLVLTPATASINVGATQAFTATLRDSAGGVLTGRVVTWSSTATAVATVSNSGLATGVSAGSSSIIAASGGRADTSALTVTTPPPPPPPPPPGATPDPTLLPVASGQAPNYAAYNALNVPAQPAGFSYNDPVTGVRVWKVTSATMPASNSGAGHDYPEGGAQVSRGWGANNNTHTILIRGDGMSYYIVDFTRGVGFSNYRRLTTQPARDLCAAFSNVAGQERILYILSGGQLVRYNTATMAVENTGRFPISLSYYAWLHQDKDDIWFTGMASDNQTVWVWNSQTGAFFTDLETWTNEPHLERDGRYVVITSGGAYTTTRVWDLSNNTLGPTQGPSLQFHVSHGASARGHFIMTDVNATAPQTQARFDVASGQLTKTVILNNSPGPDEHGSGNWIQSDAELGGNLLRQWTYVTGESAPAWYSQLVWKYAIGVQRSDGSDQRILLHHYGVTPMNYYDTPWGQPSPDGRVVIFNSNMNGSGRYDLFVAEVPLR